VWFQVQLAKNCEHSPAPGGELKAFRNEIGEYSLCCRTTGDTLVEWSRINFLQYTCIEENSILKFRWQNDKWNWMLNSQFSDQACLLQDVETYCKRQMVVQNNPPAATTQAPQAPQAAPKKHAREDPTEDPSVAVKKPAINMVAELMRRGRAVYVDANPTPTLHQQDKGPEKPETDILKHMEKDDNELFV
jgi:hypothetical protein